MMCVEPLLGYRAYRFGRWLIAALIVLLGSINGMVAKAADAGGSSAERSTVVILGDSLAAGAGVDPNEAFPSLLQKKVDEAGLKYVVVNAGVSGDTTAGGLRRIDWVLKRRVDVLVLELGGNDGLRGIPVEATRTNLQTIIDKTKQKYPAVKIIIAGMQMPPNMGEQYNQAYREIFPEIARVNHAELIPFLLEGVGGNPELNQPDHIHPNVEGHKVVAENVWKVLLLNDRFDPDWKVSVDGQPQTLLRCNYVMRGVYLETGEHTVEFRFQPTIRPLYVSLATIAIGLLLLGVVIATELRADAQTQTRSRSNSSMREYKSQDAPKPVLPASQGTGKQK